ncbi:MAG: hypothetical protein JWO86_8172, partial [Myxococcaceae bacterium]|nr:hypothetical protein [Myxococcaceae bacterium]
KNVFTKASSFKDLILAAYAKAGQDPWNEGAPDPRTLPPKPPAQEKRSGCAMAARPTSRGPGASVLALLALLAVFAACVMRRRPRC